jgi:hypothetical protein
MPAAGRHRLGDSGVVPRPLLAVVVVAAVTVLGSCDKGSREDRFCKQLAEDQSLLAVVPQDPGDFDDFVARYRQLAAIVPLAIDDQWHTITSLVEDVANADLSNPAAADRLRDRAVAATKAVDQVRAYAQSACGVNLVLATPGAAPSTAPGTPTTAAAGGAPATPSTQPGTVPPTVP